MIGSVGGLQPGGSRPDPEDLDERSRFQFLAVLQFLRDRELFDSLLALERETGLSLEECPPATASVLEASLDMFASYSSAACSRSATEEGLDLLRAEPGACCTGPAGGPQAPLGANVTAVAWVAACCSELTALAATADRRLRLFDSEGELLAELAGLSSPVLGLDVAPGAREALAVTMSGDVMLLSIRRPADDCQDEGAGWLLEVLQTMRDHKKHVATGRFAPPGQEGTPTVPLHFVTASRDHSARLYSRADDGLFVSAGVVLLHGEVTSCCWPTPDTFVLASRDDNFLHYYGRDCGTDGAPIEQLKTNLNATGDNVVSFTVLALALSPDRKLLAACTDKSRIIVLQTFSERQLRNLYGAAIDEYDVPSICFSLDQTFLYATSTLPQVARQPVDTEEAVTSLCGQVVVFQLHTGEAVLRLPCHEKAVRCLSRHPLSEHLVTGSFDKAVHYWG